MVNNKLECLLKYINTSLKKCSEKELEYLIKNEDVICSLDFHRFEMLSYKFENITFKKNSFRGAFLVDSVFFNCTFYSCSFITAVIENVKFINCKFENCVFCSIYSENNIQEKCIFIDNYIDSGFIKESQKLL
ncbi:hypothetical protein DPW01_11035 [Aggregatibacter aphrophilus]|uniref:hypothetical protein n=1 Tax=Aggregatibacter aphrophilus TaxID=732 RepID=UPI000DA35169|nr:hypothetical protein [Aggregatibacter aphrophilus]RDE88728.1 hypothetical protein DPW01_11035 [Aggregatibacter aphrophilus]SQI99667.1 Uncharacterised protein [Aggregatibacter aphrophilus]